MKIFILGSPHKIGGASGEALGAVSIWRQHGIDVDWIPTWGTPDGSVMAKCNELGTKVHVTGSARSLHLVQGLPGSTVVSFCNDNAFAARRQLEVMGCRHIFAPLMCFLTVAMRSACQQKHPSDIVFQSEYQKSQLAPLIKSLGYSEEHLHLVRGYIDWTRIPFSPRKHEAGAPFVIGRAARFRASKWHPKWWKMYERVPDRQAILLGTNEITIRQIGRAPKWAKCYKPGEVEAEDFWPELHAHVTCNDSDKENWPRTGLECMAHGVPTCAENRFGWKEMLQHEVTGMLGETPEQIGDMAARLAKDEDLRMSIVTTARKKLETEIANPDMVWEQWKKVLGL